MSKLRWSVDSLSLRGRSVFGFGWLFHEALDVRKVAVVLCDEHWRPLSSIPVEWGKYRPDVARVFNGNPRAQEAGYLVIGAFSQDIPRTHRLKLTVALSDGDTAELKIPQDKLIALDARRTASKVIALRQAGALIRKGLHQISTGQWSSFLGKVTRFVRGRPKAFLDHPRQLAAKLSHHERQRVSIIIDHDLGGGANQFRERLIKEMLARGQTVLIYCFHLATLSPVIVVRGRNHAGRYAISGEGFLLDLAGRLCVAEVVYNTAVSFAEPETIPDLLIGLKQLTGARLLLLVHDYFVVCPSHFLLNDQGEYCDLPAKEVCDRCIKVTEQTFVSFYQSGTISEWRYRWLKAMRSADEIRVFSESSFALLRRAYPDLPTAKVVVKPHTAEHLPFPPLCLNGGEHLRLGVVGQIGFHKGGKFLQALASEIERRGSSIRIVVIGTMESASSSGIVSHTGAYRQDQLPAFIEKSGANVMLFPSIWPETFSYVVQELMALDLPVASFSLGAPAERLGAYPKGLILRSMNPSSVLDELIDFHRRLYLSRESS